MFLFVKHSKMQDKIPQKEIPKASFGILFENRPPIKNRAEITGFFG